MQVKKWKSMFIDTILGKPIIRIYDGMIISIENYKGYYSYNKQRKYTRETINVVWNKNGNKYEECYASYCSKYHSFKINKIYRRDNGNIKYISYENCNGVYHRSPINGKPRPAIIRYDENSNVISQEFHIHGKELLN